jgi:hypothetical protein
MGKFVLVCKVDMIEERLVELITIHLVQQLSTGRHSWNISLILMFELFILCRFSGKKPID